MNIGQRAIASNKTTVLYGIKNKAAISLTFNLHGKPIAALVFFLYAGQRRERRGRGESESRTGSEVYLYLVCMCQANWVRYLQY